MNDLSPANGYAYRIAVEPLDGAVSVWRGDRLIASSTRARVMYETRLPPTIYFPPDDVKVDLSRPTPLQTFCPFKGTASYMDVLVGGETVANGAWSYRNALPESRDIEGFVGFMPSAHDRVDLGRNTLRSQDEGNISGPLVDWLLREATAITEPDRFTRALAGKLQEHGIAVSRLSVLIWSLHPLIVGKNYVWTKDGDEVATTAPTYEIHSHPAFINSPLRHVSKGLGGIRQRLDIDLPDNSYPIMQDLRAAGATDYVAMPLAFSDGRINVLTLTSDRPDGFTTADLGLVFELSNVVSRFYELFIQKENARSLLETYVGKRSGARVLGGEIRRGDGDDMDAAIMFCDLRHSTRLEQSLGRVRYIDMLNTFFETVSTIVHNHGGEVLKFIGDAVLAVFPAGSDRDQAQTQALVSAQEIVRQLRRDGSGQDYDCSIGIAFGGVTYGNVGSRERLDFTVIGQAANIAARLGDYGKRAGHRIVVSAEFAKTGAMQDLGHVELHNVSHPVQCYAVPAEG